MKTPLSWKISQTVILAALALVFSIWSGSSESPALAQENQPLMFIENVGQFPVPATGEAIRFQLQAAQATLSLTDQALWFTLLEKPEVATQAADSPNPQPLIPDLQRGLTLKLSFLEANLQPRLEPFNRLDTHVSYFASNDPANWRSDVPVWGGIRYVDLYPGLDLEITSENGQLIQRLVSKEDVAIADTSPLANIHWQVEGADTLTLDGEGRLRLTTALGDFALPLPQAVDLSGAPLGLPAVAEVNGLEITAPFSSTPLSLDSSAQITAISDLLYSTYLGGPGQMDSGRDIAVNTAGQAYITGGAYPGFPTTPGVFDPSVEGVFSDVFIAKFNPTGTGLVYATFLGGSDFETGQAIKLDEAGNAFIAGYTTSPDFPTTPGAYDSSLNGESDAFITKLNADGTALIYSTLLGGNNGIDFGLALATDAAGYAYISGFTEASDFPNTVAGYHGGLTDAFATKIAPDGSSLVYSTLLGGAAGDYSYGLALDQAGNVYVTGYTYSSNFYTTPGAYDSSLSDTDAFVVKLTSSGQISYATLLGGSNSEFGYAVAINNAGEAYLTGFTDSPNFPVTPDAFDPTFSGGYSGDAFVAKLAASGNSLLYATYLGGNHYDYGEDILLDATGSIYVTGITSSIDFPTTPGAFDRDCLGCNQTFPSLDVFVTKLRPNGSLAYSSFFGGDNDYDRGNGLALGGIDQVFLTGSTNASDLPVTPGAFDTTLDGFSDAFVAKLFIRAEAEPPPAPPVPSHTCAPTPLGTVTVGQEPRGLAVDSARRRVYVANFGSDNVSVIDSHTNTVIATIAGITAATGITHDSVHNVIWVTNAATDQVTPIQINDTATAFTVLPAISVGDLPWGVAYDPVHNYIYVANALSDTISIINAETRAPVAILGNNFLRPFHLAANPVTGKVYVVNFGGPTQNVAVLDGTVVIKKVSLFDSKEPYGLAIDETRNLVYVATVEPHRIVVIGPRNGVPDQFLGWAAFNRGFGNPRRPLPLRVIAVNPTLGPPGDGGHLWATTTKADGSEANQALFIPKGWGGYFHVPLAQNVELYPADGIAIDRTTNRVYVSSGFVPGIVTVTGDHATLCRDAFSKVASPETETDPDQIGVEIWENKEDMTESTGDVNGDGLVNIFDLTLVASYFGASNSTTDLNRDGQVNILDIAIVADHYGR